MKIKSALLLPAAIAMLMSALPMTSVVAQTQSPSVPQTPRQPGARPNKLNLSDAEKAQMQQAMQRMRDRVMTEVLTDAQRQQLQTLQQTQPGQSANGQRNWQGKRGGYKALNLTDAQKQQVKAIREQEFSQLPAELRQKLETRRNNMQQRRNSRQQRRQNQPNTTQSPQVN